MSVDLQPAELGFRRPFDHEVTEVLKLGNANSTPVAFKVKTTAPKQYCVRPNSGVIQPNSTVEVQVLLQAMKEEPPLDAKCRDKFLVQTVAVAHDQDENTAGLWQTIEKTAKQTIQERKIRVNFLPPSGSGTHGVTSSGGIAGATTNGMSSSEEHPPAYSSPTPQFGSPAPASASEVKTRDVPATEGVKATTANTTEATGLAGAAAAISNAVPTSGDEVKQQLEAARAQISKLTSQLQDPQIRQRKVQEAGEKMQSVVQQTSETGVPLQIVAGLCLLSFLIAYLFF